MDRNSMDDLPLGTIIAANVYRKVLPYDSEVLPYDEHHLVVSIAIRHASSPY